MVESGKGEQLNLAACRPSKANREHKRQARSTAQSRHIDTSGVLFLEVAVGRVPGRQIRTSTMIDTIQPGIGIPIPA